MSEVVYVYLTGGLGNQMFQLAAALANSTSCSSNVYIDAKLGHPRITGGTPDVLHFRLPPNIRVFERSSTTLSRKIASFMFRMGLVNSRVFRNRILRESLSLVGRLLLSLRYRAKVFAEVHTDVGFNPVRRFPKQLLLGYFQSYRYLGDPRIHEIFTQMVPLEGSRKLFDLIAKATEEQPIFVHVRLGDYVQEKHFGIPEVGYYRRALSRLDANNRNIWVFSDSLSDAKAYLPNEFEANYTFIDDSCLTPAQLMYLLRFGCDYVIANSTFSWWGAFLRMNTKGVVVAPDPWFASMPEPRDLIPMEWLRERAQE
jgi:hypothetical protein